MTLNKNILDKEITVEELVLAVKDTKNNKTPGCDGIPIEFYKVFWNKRCQISVF